MYACMTACMYVSKYLCVYIYMYVCTYRLLVYRLYDTHIAYLAIYSIVFDNDFATALNILT